ncbi:MAG TPA: ABC transporter permease, partial [Vulgatibacter sp.]
MARPFRQTEYRPGLLWAGGIVALAGAIMLGIWLSRLRAEGAAILPEIDLGLVAIGWGPAVEALLTLFRVPAFSGHGVTALPGTTWLLLGGSASWLAGWALVALGIRRAPPITDPPSPAVGAPLNPQLARYVDFYWGTVAAYGGGILLSELLLILVHTLLAGSLGVPPPGAFALALLVGFGIAFLAGFFGAANARRLSAPEATIALVYAGLPIPILLTIRHYVPELQLRFGYLLREITYVAELIGRPEVSYWLVFAGLVLAMVLGITTGFVATGSGRIDVRTGFELFVARR